MNYRTLAMIIAVTCIAFSGCADDGSSGDGDADVDAADAVGDADVDVVPDADADVEPDADADVEPDADADVEPDADADVEPDSDADVVPDADADVEPDADADVEPDSDADVVSDADPDAQNDAADAVDVGGDLDATFIDGSSDADASDSDASDAMDADDAPADADADTGASPYGLDERPTNASCLAPPRPVLETDVEFVPAFENLTFSQPVAMVQREGDSSRWYVIEQGGRIVSFPDDEAATEDDVTVVLDVTDRVACCGERGLLGMAFHVEFADNGELYVNYTGRDGGLETRIARFTGTADGFDADTEEILLTVDQPFSNHNGGTLLFGNDGYLYVGMGDGGDGGDPMRHGQNTDTLLGAMLRIDVDVEESYAIPSDNPFADGGGAPEIYAWGLRNPWKFSVDRPTGDIWIGDVGQNAIEEVDLLAGGANYGWNIEEGTQCYRGNPECGRGDLVEPVAEYPHSEGRSITGGVVYRGSDIPSLAGVYLYGDYVTGRIWGLFADPDTGALEPRELADLPFYVSSFGLSNDGEAFVVSRDTGRLYRLVPREIPDPVEFPALLSTTGCVDADDPTSVVDALIPYAPNAPFWSDGAAKERWFAIPDGTQIEIADDGDFVFPVGTVLMKTFRLDDRRIETRLFVRHDDGGWGGYTYAWRGDQSDADLLPAGDTVDVGGQTWIYPSRAQCLQCHTQAAGGSLGLEVAQLEGNLVYPTGRTSNQLDTLDHLGMLATPRAELPDVAALADPHGDGPIDQRARAWLHTNCSSCHRPGAPTPVEIDLRAHVALSETGTCDVVPGAGDLGVDDARIIAPSAPERSTLVLRTATRDVAGMPPIASNLVDDDGVSLLESWIGGLSECVP